MGSTSRFRCESCGYEAAVSGGPDVGFLMSTRTVFCRACQTLCDVTTGPSCEGLPGTGNLDPASWNRCPSCGTTDVTPWDEGNPCPRCTGVVANRGLVTLWD